MMEDELIKSKICEKDNNPESDDISKVRPSSAKHSVYIKQEPRGNEALDVTTVNDLCLLSENSNAFSVQYLPTDTYHDKQQVYSLQEKPQCNNAQAEYVRHVRMEVEIDGETINDDVCEFEETFQNSTHKNHTPDLCGKAFKGQSHLLQHFTTHSEEVCSRCKESFKTRDGLVQHLLQHSEERPFCCNHCKKTFKTKQQLIKHFHVHSQERPYCCNQCEKTFKLKRVLDRHLFVHSEQRPHCCNHCEKSFKLKNNLIRHLSVVHSEERLHCCNYCDKTFKTNQNLMQHLFVHSEERPHCCDQCKKTFKTRHLLVQHIKCVHSEQRSYCCDHCEKTFKTEQSLIKHISLHSMVSSEPVSKTGWRGFDSRKGLWKLFCHPSIPCDPEADSVVYPMSIGYSSEIQAAGNEN